MTFMSRFQLVRNAYRLILLGAIIGTRFATHQLQEATMKYLLILLALSGCADIDYSYNLDEYNLDVPQEGLCLPSGGSCWHGSYDYRVQPQDGYCGPVALKNMLSWYDRDISWDEAAEATSVNDFHSDRLFGYCAAACLGELVCAVSLYEVVRSRIKGSSRHNIIKAMTEHAPAGYTVEFTAEEPAAIDELIEVINGGDPVLIFSVIDGNLHTSVLTGFYYDGETLNVSQVNSYKMTISEFMYSWSLKGSGNKTERSVMAKFGNLPFMAAYYKMEE